MQYISWFSILTVCYHSRHSFSHTMCDSWHSFIYVIYLNKATFSHTVCLWYLANNDQWLQLWPQKLIYAIHTLPLSREVLGSRLLDTALLYLYYFGIDVLNNIYYIQVLLNAAHLDKLITHPLGTTDWLQLPLHPSHKHTFTTITSCARIWCLAFNI